MCSDPYTTTSGVILVYELGMSLYPKSKATYYNLVSTPKTTLPVMIQLMYNYLITYADTIPLPIYAAIWAYLCVVILR